MAKKNDFLPVRQRILDGSIPEPNTGCWLWLKAGSGHKSKYGDYGRIGVGGKTMAAHRASFEAFKHPLPKGMNACHNCDMPCCVNPDHLFAGTQLDNMKDRDKKGRRAPPKGVANGFAKLDDTKVRAIKIALRSQKEIQARIAQRFNIDQTTVSLIKLGKRWAHA